MKKKITLWEEIKCPLNPLLVKKGGILIPRKSVVKTIESLQDELDLVDIWRIKNSYKKKVLCRARTLQWSFVVWTTG